MVHSDGIWNDLELQKTQWKQGRQMVHADGIWNDLELQRTQWKQGRQMVHSDGTDSDTIFRPAEKILKAMYLYVAFCHYLIRYFDLLWTFWKQCIYMLYSATIWYDISTCFEHFESNVSKCCILPLFDTKFRPALKKLKAMYLNVAFCHYLIRYFDLQRKFGKQCI